MVPFHVEMAREMAQAALTLALAPGAVGLVRFLKARVQGRRGARPWQPYREVLKLFHKEVVISERASWIFRVTPYVVFAATLTVALLVPLVAVSLPLDRVGDLVVVVYLLMLATFSLSL